MTKPSRRFIAGAVCPQCRALDRLVIERTEEGLMRRCGACDYSDLQAHTGTSSVPRGKGDKSAQASRVRSVNDGDKISPVRIINPSDGTD